MAYMAASIAPHDQPTGRTRSTCLWARMCSTAASTSGIASFVATAGAWEGGEEEDDAARLAVGERPFAHAQLHVGRPGSDAGFASRGLGGGFHGSALVVPGLGGRAPRHEEETGGKKRGRRGERTDPLFDSRKITF